MNAFEAYKFINMDDNYVIDVTVGEGKYRVIMPKGGGLKALRYGKEWRDCCGDGLIYQLAVEITNYRELLREVANDLYTDEGIPLSAEIYDKLMTYKNI